VHGPDRRRHGAAKGGACVATDPQLCYKTCGPEKSGAKSETCTGGVYAEMSGCSFDSAKDFACYKIPAAANTMCPRADAAGVADPARSTCASSATAPAACRAALQRLGRRRQDRLLCLPGAERGRQADLELRRATRRGPAPPASAASSSTRTAHHRSRART
jgi:hypothetical protein